MKVAKSLLNFDLQAVATLVECLNPLFAIERLPLFAAAEMVQRVHTAWQAGVSAVGGGAGYVLLLKRPEL